MSPGLFVAFASLAGALFVGAIVAVRRRQRGLRDEPTGIFQIIAVVWGVGLAFAAIVQAFPGSASGLPVSVLAAATAVAALLRRRELLSAGRNETARQFLWFGMGGIAIAVINLVVSAR